MGKPNNNVSSKRRRKAARRAVASANKGAFFSSAHPAASAPKSSQESSQYSASNSSQSIVGILPQIRITPRRLKESLTTAEILTIGMFVFYAVLGAIFADRVDNALMFIVVNLCGVWLQCALAVSVSETDSGRVFRSLLIARRFFLLPAIFFIYAQAHLYVTHVNPRDFDEALARWDFALFGVNPTQWMYQFAHPALTEFLQICYFLYFWIPAAIGVELYATRAPQLYIRYTLYVACVSYALYLGYFFMPAIGPCFTLHDFSALSRELPGLALTEPLRAIVNNGSGAETPAPHLTAHRNCMPSGHTMVALLNMLVAFRWRSRFRWAYLIIGLGIIVSTVYLRYHYVVDLLAGAAVTLAAVAGGRILERQFQKFGFRNA
jgi:membrane-associated phospholipid phosphatase